MRSSRRDNRDNDRNRSASMTIALLLVLLGSLGLMAIIVKRLERA